jgi:hypothetical protein
MGADPQQGEPANQSGKGLAETLAPALVDACDGRLSEIVWFRTTWQAGGASTGNAKFQFEDGPRDVVIKVPVGPREHRFTLALAEREDLMTPRVAAAGDTLGGYDLAWLVMERVPGRPLAGEADARSIRDAFDAAAAVQQAATEIGGPLEDEDRTDWEALLQRARDAAHDNPIPEQQRWNNAIKRVQKGLGGILSRWQTRRIDTWCHGDLHLGNVMRRPEGSPWGAPGCVLLDFSEIRPGHWVEDAVYFERVFWGHTEALKGVKPVSQLAKARRKLGLENGDDYQETANLRRVLTAACAPAYLQREGNPAYLAAALETLERLTPSVA